MKSRRGHHCHVCGRFLSNERFSGRGHAQHICNECRRARRRERRAASADGAQPGFELRPYRPSDLEALVRLFTDSVRVLGASAYDPDQCAAWAPDPPDVEGWRRRLESLETLVAEDGGGLVGFLSFDRRGLIEFLYTAPASARHGVATALLLRAERALLLHGLDELHTEASLVARPFFERHGFVVLQEHRVERRGLTFRRFAMRKDLRREC